MEKESDNSTAIAERGRQHSVRASVTNLLLSFLTIYFRSLFLSTALVQTQYGSLPRKEVALVQHFSVSVDAGSKHNSFYVYPQGAGKSWGQYTRSRLWHVLLCPSGTHRVPPCLVFKFTFSRLPLFVFLFLTVLLVPSPHSLCFLSLSLYAFFISFFYLPFLILPVRLSFALLSGTPLARY